MAYTIRYERDGSTGKNFIRLFFTDPDFYVIINKIDILEEADENGNNVSVDFNTEHPLDTTQREMFDNALFELIENWQIR